MATNANYSVILDAARLDHEMKTAHGLNPDGVSLYKGQPEEELSDVAPFLFSCEEQPEFMKWMVNTGWGKAWGIFALTNVDFTDLHRHFRRFLMVKTEDGVQLYFRFYDPRVLRIFLPTCDSTQLREFFGPVSKFVCEDEDSEFALVFFHDNTKLLTKRIPAREILTEIAKEKIEVPASEKSVDSIEEKNNTIASPGVENKENNSADQKNETQNPKNEDPEKPKSRFKFY